MLQAHWERDDLARERAWAQESKLQATQERERLLEEAQEGLYADALVFGRRLKESRAELEVRAGQLAEGCRFTVLKWVAQAIQQRLNARPSEV